MGTEESIDYEMAEVVLRMTTPEFEALHTTLKEFMYFTDPEQNPSMYRDLSEEDKLRLLDRRVTITYLQFEFKGLNTTQKDSNDE